MNIKNFLLSFCIIFLSACMATHPLPQPRKVVNPSSVQGSIISPQWDIAALKYQYEGQGLNYAKAGLLPVFLVFKNKTNKAPYVLLEEIHGISPTQGEYLPYTPEEAARIVFASESFKQTTKNALRSGTLGAVIGAGLGALFAALGGDNIAAGAAIGGAIGGTALGVSSVPEAEQKLERIVKKEITTYAWKEAPIPPMMTKMGYVYFPGKKNITSILLTVRTIEGELITYRLPILNPPSKKNKP
ncbi:hypothetical protein SAMN04488516_102220 [Desulfonauticus submarinus]|uniref:Glycine zipper n=1 Tax=Desulfonauticus submarinus TaxID=206665 RepID=A0A1H0BLW0_9BACT|nr:hypothetical protein [Desulfonauticus submarinus]SDN46646.1 hypothetical protein SAMN04488516_102220 [Desulfonauticus submarinus]